MTAYEFSAHEALQTDLYQISMLLGYLQNGVGNEMATFELSLRKLPPYRNYFVAAGIEAVVDYLQNLHFSEGQIAYLQSFAQFAHLSPKTWDALRNFHFSGELWAVSEGTVMFQDEPVLFIRAPRAEAQLVETFALGVVRSHTKFASRASRIVSAAQGKEVLEFGSRHIHPELAPSCAYSAYIAGFAATSNVEAGMRYGIPTMDIRGTMAHAFVMSFETELEAFRAYARTYPDHSVLLVDTYDTVSGIKNAITVGKELEASGHHLRGIRIDSGDLVADSNLARKMLDESGFGYVKIVVSGDLNEKTISELVDRGSVDTFGVGKSVSTVDDSPHMDAAYKLCEHELDGQLEYAIKLSAGKATWPGLKQVYRYNNEKGLYLRDEVCQADEVRPGATALLHQVMKNGQRVGEKPSLEQIRAHVKVQKEGLAAELMDPAKFSPYCVERSQKLKILQQVQRKLALDKNAISGAMAAIKPAARVGP